MNNDLQELELLIKQSLNKVKLNRSEKRELNHIMSSQYYISKEDLDIYPKDDIRFKAHELLDKALILEPERKKYWMEYHKLVRSYKDDYSLKPIKEGRDNKGVYVGFGGGNRCSIRYPRKGHKNAWKQFYKLFPHLHPDHIKTIQEEIKT